MILFGPEFDRAHFEQPTGEKPDPDEGLKPVREPKNIPEADEIMPDPEHVFSA